MFLISKFYFITDFKKYAEPSKCYIPGYPQYLNANGMLALIVFRGEN